METMKHFQRKNKMKKAYSLMIATLMMLTTLTTIGTVFFSSVAAQEPPCQPDLTLPTGTVTMSTVLFPAAWDSAFQIDLTGIVGDYDVTNGSYHGWCVEYGKAHNTQPISVILQSSYSPPSHVAHQNWHQVNYVLNHKQGTRVDVQRAIWYFVNFGPWSWDQEWAPHITGPVTQETYNMIDNASLYADTWCPDCGDVIAVVCDQGLQRLHQLIIIEVPYCDDCEPSIILPAGNVSMAASLFPPVWDAAFKITIAGIVGQYDVTNGLYPGWCVEYGKPHNTFPINVTLQSSYLLPAHLAHENWHKVNYVLNHKEGTRVDIQRAILYFVNFGPWNWTKQWGPMTGNVTPETYSMINNANTYADTWCPDCGDVIAVVCDQGVQNGYQVIFIEAPLCATQPCEPVLVITVGDPHLVILADEEYCITSTTEITLEAYNQGCCGNTPVLIEYRIFFDNVWTDWMEYSTPLTFPENCTHVLEARATNCLGNSTVDSRILHVDHTPPSLNKTVGSPSVYLGLDPFGHDQWMVYPQTPITFTAQDLSCCPCDNPVISYRYWYLGSWTDWMAYDGPVHLTRGCVHYLEAYAVDCLGNSGPVDNETFWVCAPSGGDEPEIEFLNPLTGTTHCERTLDVTLSASDWETPTEDLEVRVWLPSCGFNQPTLWYDPVYTPADGLFHVPIDIFEYQNGAVLTLNAYVVDGDDNVVFAIPVTFTVCSNIAFTQWLQLGWGSLIIPPGEICCSDLVEDVLASIDGSYDWVFYRDSVTGIWYSYEYGAGGNDLIHMKAGEVYWIHMTNPDRFFTDCTAPNITITSPLDGVPRNVLTEVLGTAFDGEAGLDHVALMIHDMDANNYWDGDSWEPVATELLCDGLQAWSYNTTTVGFVNNHTFQVTALAYDNAGCSASAAVMFLWDANPPIITITDPLDNESRPQGPGDINAEVYDLETNVTSVWVRIYDETTMFYYDGMTWQVNETWLPMMHDGGEDYSYTSEGIWPAGETRSYQVTVKAYDWLSNMGIQTNRFTILEIVVVPHVSMQKQVWQPGYSTTGGNVTYVYTVENLILFGYEDDTTVTIYDDMNAVVWTGSLSDGEYHVEDVIAGVYKVVGSKKYSILTGDPLTDLVGYYAVDQNGYGLSRLFYTYMPDDFGYYNDKFIVFSYTNGTEVTITNMDTSTVVWNGVLNKADHHTDTTLNDDFVKVESTHPVSVLSYNDQGYFVPSANKKFSGTEFFGFSDDLSGWPNTLHVMAFDDGTAVMVKDTETNVEVWSGMLNAGEEYEYTTSSDLYFSVASSKDVTVGILPMNGYSIGYYHGNYVPDKTGSGIGTEFYTPCDGDGELFVFAYEDNITVQVYDPATSTLQGTYVLDTGEYADVNPGVDGYWHITSDGLISVYEGYGAAAADFAPVLFGESVGGYWTESRDAILGDVATFRIRMVNDGDCDILSGILTDYLPIQLQYVEDSTNITVHVGNQTYYGSGEDKEPWILSMGTHTVLLWNDSSGLGYYPVGAEAIFTFEALVVGCAEDPVENLANLSVEPACGDTLYAQDSAFVTIPCAQGGISGTIYYEGGAWGPVIVCLYDVWPPVGFPLDTLEVYPPDPPLQYAFTGLDPGTYYVWAFMDADWNGSYDPYDPIGFAINHSWYADPLVVTDAMLTSCDITLVDPAPSAQLCKFVWDGQGWVDGDPEPIVEVNVSDIVSYNITWMNDGNVVLTGAELVDTLPAGLAYIDESCTIHVVFENGTHWYYNYTEPESQPNVTVNPDGTSSLYWQYWETKPLPPCVAYIEYDVMVVACNETPYVNDALGDAYYYTSNFHGQDDAWVLAPCEPCQPGIDVEKYTWDPAGSWTADPTYFITGDTIMFNITAENNGTCPLTDWYIDDWMEEGLMFNNGSCTITVVQGDTVWHFTGSEAQPQEILYHVPDVNYYTVLKWWETGNEPFTFDPGTIMYIELTATVVTSEPCDMYENWACAHGYYDIDLMVSDEDWVMVWANCQQPGQPPVVDITYPQDGGWFNYTQAGYLTINGTAYDVDTYVDEVQIMLYYEEGGTKFYYNSSFGWGPDPYAYMAYGTGAGTPADPLMWQLILEPGFPMMYWQYCVHAIAYDHDNPAPLMGEDTNCFWVPEPPPDLMLSKQVSRQGMNDWVEWQQVYLGETVTYRLIVQNNGEYPFTDIVVKDLLPVECHFYTGDQTVTVNGTPYSIMPEEVENNLTWEFTGLSLAPGESIQILFDAYVFSDHHDTETNVAEVTAFCPSTGQTHTAEDVAQVYGYYSSQENYPPLAKFFYSPLSPTTADTIQFIDASLAVYATIVSWSWDFGDTGTSNEPNPTHMYTTPGEYSVVLTVVDDDAASDSMTRVLSVGYENQPPFSPHTPTPMAGERNVTMTTAVISWYGGDPDVNDTVDYYHYFGVDPNDLQSYGYTTWPATEYGPFTSNLGVALDPETMYYWKIIAQDNHGASTAGPLWNFTTAESPNNPPNQPSSPVPMNMSLDVPYEDVQLSWDGGDPDGAADTVNYSIYFGTELNPPSYDEIGPFGGDVIGQTYDVGTLAENTQYYWKIVAEDSHGDMTEGPVWCFTTALGATGLVHNIDTDEWFMEIQTAINDPDTLSGHTIEVYPSIYYENPDIDDKELTLLGIGMPVIEGYDFDCGVWISADHVVLDGFEIRGCNGEVAGIMVADDATHVRLSNNTIHDNDVGIYLEADDAIITIVDNTISGNYYGGIYGVVDSHLACYIQRNTISLNGCSGDSTGPGGSIRLQGVDNSYSIIYANIADNVMDQTDTDGGHVRVGWTDYVATTKETHITMTGNTMTGGVSGTFKINAYDYLNVHAQGNDFVELQGCVNKIGWCDDSSAWVDDMVVTFINNTFTKAPEADGYGLLKINAFDTIDATFVGNTFSHSPQGGTLRIGWTCDFGPGFSQVVNAEIQGNTFTDNHGGAILVYAASELTVNISDNVVDGTACSGERHAVEACSGGDIQGSVNRNTMMNFTNAGIFLYGSDPYGVEVNENQITEGDVGILIVCDEVLIQGNEVLHMEEDGIMLEESSECVVRGNYVDDCGDDAFDLDLSYANTIANNTGMNSGEDGIDLQESDGNFIYNNTFSGNLDDGLSIDRSHNNSIMRNIVTGNFIGIEVFGPSTMNLIFDNLFNNTQNAWDDGVNHWNITKTAGTNIIGGPYLGGNYYSDYTGSDTTGDGLGEDPYLILGGSNQDHHPLTTPGMPPGPVMNLDTGESFQTIQAAIDDPDTLDSHTIVVSTETYHENIDVYKQLTLQAASTPVLDAMGGTAMTITAENVVIDGFTIQNATKGIVCNAPGFTLQHNHITTSDDGISFIKNNLGVSWVGDETLVIGQTRILNNEITAAQDGIYWETISWGTNMHGTTSMEVGAFIIHGNTIEAQKYGIDAYGIKWWGNTMSGDSEFSFEGLYVTNNTITAGVAGYGDGIEWDDIWMLGKDMYDNACFILGDIIFSNNTITCEDTGIEIYLFRDFGYNMHGSSSFVWDGNYAVVDNTIQSQDSEGLRLEYIGHFGNHMNDSSSFVMQDVSIARNYVVSMQDDAASFDSIEEYGYFMGETSSFSMGSLSINDNTFITYDETSYGVDFYEFDTFGRYMYGTSTFSMEDIILSGNTVMGGEQGWEDLNYNYFGCNMYNEAVFSMGDIMVIGNTITSTEMALEVDEISDMGYNLHNSASCSIGDIIIADNILTSTDEHALYIYEFDSLGYHLYDEATVEIGDIHITGNIVNAGNSMGYGIWVDNIRYIGIELHGTSEFTLGEIQLYDNNVTSCFLGINITDAYRMGEYNVDPSAHCTIGNISIFSNMISSCDTGLGLLNEENLTVYDNIIDHCFLGIYISGNDSLLYNNFLNNTNNAYDSGVNTWNIEKTAGTNIIGGPYLGGNYYSDYTGSDTTGDGLGEDPYPIPGGMNQDIYPLCPVGFTPITTMGILPSASEVMVGNDFTATVYLDPIVPIGGWQINLLSFTEEYAQATLVTPGSEWTSFFDAGTIDNVTGAITDIQTWKMDSYPDYNHTACVISFTALAPGLCHIRLMSVQVTDDLFNTIAVQTYNATVTII